MIEVSSLLRCNKTFVNIFEHHDAVDDPRYIEGAIVLRINHILLMDTSMWDYVDQLWIYLLEGLEHVKLAKPFECLFPDQPITIRLHPGQGSIIFGVTVDENIEVTADASELVNALSVHCESFFKALSDLPNIGRGRYCREIERAQQLRT